LASGAKGKEHSQERNGSLVDARMDGHGRPYVRAHRGYA